MVFKMEKLRNITLTIIFAFAASATMYAQDIIVTVKAEKIEAKITEIDIDVVRYKQYDYQDGPTYILKKSDIDSIVFQNGKTTVFEHPQEAEPQFQKVEETKLQEENAETIDSIDYEKFKKMNDEQMANFLKENDSVNYAIFHLGEINKSTARRLLIPGIVLSSVGVASLAIGYVVVPFFLTVSIFGLLVMDDWFKNTAPWFWKIGVPFIVMGQSFFIASIVLRKSGKALQQEAIDNYANKFFKDHTTSLNFNFYPNGFGISLKF